ncbi:hypothetical protein BG004_004626 [Podila humilis]|nr:hypothetical protein BG004_004626 [Podila humilis]
MSTTTSYFSVTSPSSTATATTTSPTGSVNATISATPSSISDKASPTSFLNPNGTLDSMTFTGVPLRTVFYFIAFMAVLMGISYAVFLARRDRRRRRQSQNQDTEAGRHTSTFRPTDGDEDSPPVYRAYMLDQPYVDPEMVVITPQEAHFDRHIAALEQHRLVEPNYNTNGASSPTVSSYTTTTMTTTTLSTFMPVSSVRSVEASSETQRSATSLPLSAASTTVSTSTTAETPVITTPVPAASFLSGRHLSILRFGLRGSNDIHHSGTSPRNSVVGTSSSSSASHSRSPSPTRSIGSLQSSTMLLSASDTNDSQDHEGSQPQMTEVATTGGQHPILHRLRSQGPPPYISMSSSDEAPSLPPSYNIAIVQATQS